MPRLDNSERDEFKRIQRKKQVVDAFRALCSQTSDPDIVSGFNLCDLAEKTGCSPRTLYRWLGKKPLSETFIVINGCVYTKKSAIEFIKKSSE